MNDFNLASMLLPGIAQRTVKFCCFSENIRSAYMWGLYSSNESGFALEYDFTEQPYAASPSELKDRQCAIFPVIYGKEMFQLSKEYLQYLLMYRWINIALKESGVMMSDPFFAERFLKSGICPDLSVVTKISLCKSEEWEKEMEWRLFCSSNADVDFQNQQHGYCIKRPKGLYLGRRISYINEKILKCIASEKKIPVYKMGLDDGSPCYALTTQVIENS